MRGNGRYRSAIVFIRVKSTSLSKPFALPVDPIVAGRHELLLDLPKFGSHALGHRLPSEHEAAAIPPGPAIVLEP